MMQVALVDLRKGSKTYGQRNTLYVGDRRPWQILIPPGVAHGYKVIWARIPAVLVYVTSRFYNPADELRVPYDDTASTTTGRRSSNEAAGHRRRRLHWLCVRPLRAGPPGDVEVITLDKLTYAGNLDNLAPVPATRGTASSAATSATRAVVAVVDAAIDADRPLRGGIARRPEHPVGRSDFIETNVRGTATLLDAARKAKIAASCTSRPTKSTATSTRRSKPTRRTRCAEQPVRGVEGRRRPAHALLLPHLQAAGRRSRARRTTTGRISSRRS